MADQQANHDGSEPPVSPGPNGSDSLADVEVDVEALRQAVAENLGRAYWWVDEGQWSTVQPGLPDDLTLLLAPPIVVGAVPVAAGAGSRRSAGG